MSFIGFLSDHPIVNRNSVEEYFTSFIVEVDSLDPVACFYLVDAIFGIPQIFGQLFDAQPPLGAVGFELSFNHGDIFGHRLD